MKIHLKIKSNYIQYLNEFINKMQKYLNKDLNIIKLQVFLPAKTEKYTVLRSPHADKKARDQFERKTYKRLIILELEPTKKNNLKIDHFFGLLQQIAIGIEFQIKYIR